MGAFCSKRNTKEYVKVGEQETAGPTEQDEEDTVDPTEEDEEELYSQRSKLYRFYNQEWKERGLGNARLLRHKKSGNVRFLMRQLGTSKVVANFSVVQHEVYCDLRPNAGSEKSWVWTAQDCSDGDRHVEKFALSFKTPELATQFKEAFDDAKVRNAYCGLPQGVGEVYGPGPSTGVGEVYGQPYGNASFTFTISTTGPPVTILWSDYAEYFRGLPSNCNANHIDAWLNSPNFKADINQIFKDSDKLWGDGNCILHWNPKPDGSGYLADRGAIFQFAKEVFKSKGLPFFLESDDSLLYAMFNLCDVNKSSTLNQSEAFAFTEAILRGVLHFSGHVGGGKDGHAKAEAQYTTSDPEQAPSDEAAFIIKIPDVNPPKAVTVLWSDYVELFEALTFNYNLNLIKGWLASSKFKTDVTSIFKECGNGSERLEWNPKPGCDRGEIFRFEKEVFIKKGLPWFGDSDDRILYAMYKLVDVDDIYSLDKNEAVALTEAILRGILIFCNVDDQIGDGLDHMQLQELRALVKKEKLNVKTNVGGHNCRTKVEFIADIRKARKM